VILPDVNLLLYAVDRKSPQHSVARKWLEETLSGGEDVRLAWLVILAFLRLTTLSARSAQPMTIDAAFAIMQGWLDHPSVSIAQPGPEHPRILRRLLTQVGTGGNLTTDAHLAALAMEYGAQLCSSDNDFARFPGLNWHNPLHPPLK
jgi:toxin-antitoxin system PIN domain toxin